MHVLYLHFCQHVKHAGFCCSTARQARSGAPQSLLLSATAATVIGGGSWDPLSRAFLEPLVQLPETPVQEVHKRRWWRYCSRGEVITRLSASEWQKIYWFVRQPSVVCLSGVQQWLVEENIVRIKP